MEAAADCLSPAARQQVRRLHPPNPLWGRELGCRPGLRVVPAGKGQHTRLRGGAVCVPWGGCQTAELGCASRGTPLAVPGLSEQQRGALSARGVCGGPAVVRLGLQSALGYGV